MIIGSLLIEMSANVARLQKDMAAARSTVNQATKSINSAISTTKNMLGTLGIAVTFSAIVDEAGKAEQEMNRFNALLRITGAQAGFTRGELESMGKTLEDSSHFDDEDILRGQSTFLKFGNIQKQVFEEGMKLAADYAAFTGGTFADGAQAVGRALQSPTLGLKALQLELGRLTPEQEQHIKLLMEQNKLADAQGVVLEFVRGKIGGVASEMNQGFLARTSALSKEMGNLMEAIGRSSAGDAAKSLLGFGADTLRDMKNIVESGDWIEKVQNTVLLLAGFRGMDAKGVPGGQPGRESKGRIGGLPDTTPAPGPTEEFLAKQKKAREEAAKKAKQLQDENRKGYIKYYDALVDADFEATKTLADIQIQEAKEWRDREDRLQKEGIAGWVAYAQALVDANFEEAQQLAEIQSKTADEVTEFWRSAAQNMQSSMSSFFFDVMQGNLSDLSGSFKRTVDQMAANILAAKASTELFGANFGKEGVPLGGWVGKGVAALGGMFGGGAGAASWTSGFDLPMGAFATGGSFTVGGSGGTDSKLVSFMATPGERVNVQTPAQQRENGAGRGITVNQAFHITGPVDSRSRSQLEAAALAGAQRALMRNA